MRSVSFRLLELAAFMAAMTMGCGVQAAPTKAAASPCSRVETGPVVRLPLGKSTLLKPPAPVMRLLLGNPQNTQAARPAEKSKEEDKAPSAAARTNVAELDVLLLSPNEIFLLGKTLGATNLLLQSKDGLCTMFDVVVGLDTTALNSTLREFLPAEGGVKVTSAGDALVLSGTVSDATVVDRVLDITGAFVRTSTGGGGGRQGNNERVINLLQVAAPQQVMLEVKVAEISKALLDQYGINFTRALVSADGSMVRFMNGLFGGSGLIYGQVAGASGATVGSGMVGSNTNGAFTVGTAVGAGGALVPGQNTTIVNADMQKQDGLVKVLAEPTVMAISGQEGSFLAGGRVFIPVQTNNGGVSAIGLEEREFGVSLRFTPTVLAGGRINLKVNPEVSEPSSRGLTVSTGGIGGTMTLPSFITRRAATTVQLRDGQSFAIGGLIKNNVSSSITSFPFLGELPIIGALFRSTSFQNDRTELVFVITPRLVQPLPASASAYPLPTDAYSEPTRYDMIMSGRLEGRQPSAPPPAVPAESASAPAQGGFEVK